MIPEPKSKIKKVFHQISKDLSSQVSSSKMEEPFPITTSRRSQPFIWSSDLEEVVWDRSKSSHPLPLLPESTSAIRWFAESVMSSCHQRQSTAERESAAITVTSDQRRRLRAELSFLLFMLSCKYLIPSVLRQFYGHWITILFRTNFKYSRPRA